MHVSQGYAEPDWGYGHYGNWSKNMSPRGGKPQHMGQPMPDYGYPYAKSSQGMRSGRKSPTLNKRATDDPKKVFVGGLPKETTKQNMEEYFGKFGEVVDCYVVTDPKSGRTRGFGFVKFNSPEAVEEVMDSRPHSLLEKDVLVKRVLNMEKQENLFTSKTLFVGGLGKEQTEEDLRDYFSKYGNIEEVTVAKDRDGNPRKFAMVTFDDYDAVDKVMALGKKSHNIKGGQVGCKKFLSKEELAKLDSGRRERYSVEQDAAAAEWYAMQAQMEHQMAQMSLGPAAGYGPGSGGGGDGQDYGYGAYSHVIGKERQRGGGGGKKQSLLQQASVYYSGPASYGYGGGPALSGVRGGQGDGYGAASPENTFLAKLKAANMSEEGITALARENLLNPDVLASLNPVEFAQVPLKIGDRKRVQIVLGSIGYGGN